MNSFMHLVFPARGTTIDIKRTGKRVRITVEGNIGERIVIEVDRPAYLKLDGEEVTPDADKLRTANGASS